MNESLNQKPGVIWAAGLFEGEGCISQQNGYKDYVLLRLSLSSTDEDVVRRFYNALGGVGSVRGPLATRGKAQKANWKPHWAWTTSGLKAMAVLELLYPWFGKRRREKTDEIIAKVEQNPRRNKPPAICTLGGCDRLYHARGMCKPHYMQWHYLNGKVGVDLRCRQQ